MLAPLRLNTGAGNDRVNVHSVQAITYITTGEGSDTVDIDSTADTAKPGSTSLLNSLLYVDMGSGMTPVAGGVPAAEFDNLILHSESDTDPGVNSVFKHIITG